MGDSIRKGARSPIAVPTIILANVVVFGMWYLQKGLTPEQLEKYFTTSWISFYEQKNYISLLGSAFSHQMLLHIAINMYMLYNFGTLLELVLGARFFLLFYCVAGAFASLSHCVTSAFILGAPATAVVGASGAISGLVIIFSLMFANEKLLILGILPVPAIFGSLIFVGLDIWGLMAQAKGGGLPIGHGAHLGGALAGVVAYLLFIRPRIMRRRRKVLERGY